MNLSCFALRASNFLSNVPFVHDAARRVYCAFFPGMRFQVQKTFRNFEEVFVLKIGANDGVENDPLADFLLNDRRYRGVLVEPIPLYAKMLGSNYDATKRFKIEQVAIASNDGNTIMYYIDENAADSDGQPIPKWLRGVASLDCRHVEKHVSPEMRGAIRQTTVECLSVASLLARNKIRTVDLLHIDAEGYDFILLQQFNFAVIRPKVVIFERKHLSKHSELAAKALMEQAGYEVKTLETDFFCITR